MDNKKKSKPAKTEDIPKDNGHMLSTCVSVLGRLLHRLDDDETLSEISAASALTAAGTLMEKIERMQKGRGEDKKKTSVKYPNLKKLLENPLPKRKLEDFFPKETENQKDENKK